MRSFTCCLSILCLWASPCYPQPGQADARAVTYEISYTGDMVSNLSGGLQTGTGYLGMAGIQAGWNVEKGGLWKGGMFSLRLINTHGAMPSSEYIGDLQVVSNIEAGNHTCFQEMWFRQRLGILELTAGLQDLNAEFAVTDMASAFINSSFGIFPTLTGNLPAPVFPLTAPGILFRLGLGQSSALRLAVFDGCPTAFEHNRFNLAWNLSGTDGALAVMEWQFSGVEMSQGTSLRLGMYARRHGPPARSDGDDPSLLPATCYGFYSLAEGYIWQSPRSQRKAGVFLQTGLSPFQLNTLDFYAGLGTVLTGLARKDGEDRLGFAIAHASLSDGEGHETTLECTFNLPVTRHFYIQPDFQLVLHPAGTNSNAWVGILRAGIVL